jgi:hypothetical protein
MPGGSNARGASVHLRQRASRQCLLTPADRLRQHASRRRCSRQRFACGSNAWRQRCSRQRFACGSVPRGSNASRQRFACGSVPRGGVARGGVRLRVVRFVLLLAQRSPGAAGNKALTNVQVCSKDRSSSSNL